MADLRTIRSFHVLQLMNPLSMRLPHRDYGIQLPVECMHYKDAFVVGNSGRILQRNRDLPSQFSLDDTTLDSMPRNPKLIEWLKIMRDEDGAEFVRALSEGTKRNA